MHQIRDNLSKNEIAEIITNKIGLSTSYNKKIINEKNFTNFIICAMLLLKMDPVLH
jgi:hypothetical protein